MKQADLSLYNHPGVPWQVLGELELSVDSNVDHQIQRWLVFSLNPLELPQDFLDKMMKSAQAAAARAVKTRAALRSEHIHLRVFAQESCVQKGQTWGFFRIEKFLGAREDLCPTGHSIEFYIYIEG